MSAASVLLSAPLAIGSLVHAADEEFDPNTVTPGVWGFVITFGIMIAVTLLVIDMTRRIRRTNYRAEVREELAREMAEQDAADSAAANGSTTDDAANGEAPAAGDGASPTR